MAIEFNEKDFQISRIRQGAKLKSFQTKNPFRVYGLVTKGNPLIHISYNYDTVVDGFDDNLKPLKAWFKKNGLELQVESGGGTPKVCIGLRRDLRDHIVLCSTLLRLIILALEDQLDFQANYQVEGIPTFPNASGKTLQRYRAVAQE